MPPAPHATSWDDFRLVSVIAETGSLTAAAEKLALNHSTVFRRLGQLEESLGTRLFERSRNGYVATSLGDQMVTLAAGMGEAIDEFERKAAGRDDKPAGDLRVTVNDVMLVHLLTPIFASFSANYPAIRLHIVVSNQALNLSRRDADVAIRATNEPSETLVGRRFGDLGWGRYAPALTTFDAESPAARWIGFGDNLAHIAPARWLEKEIGAERIFYRINTLLGMAEAIAAGIGMGLLPCSTGDTFPGLRRIGAPMQEFRGSLWLLTHPDLRNAARVRAFMDHVGGELMKRRKSLTGEG